MYSNCLYGEPYEENSTGCHIVDERNERIELLEREVNSFKQALNEIKTIIKDCKKLMPHEFDWGEQTDSILEKIDKVLGGDKENI